MSPFRFGRVAEVIHQREYVALHIKRMNVRSIIAVLEKCQAIELAQALWVGWMPGN